MGLQLRNRRPKRRVKAKLREDRQEAIGPNDVWAMDFVHDQLATGRKLRILTVVDTHSRLAPGARPAVLLPGRGRGSDPGAGLRPDRLSEHDPGRQRQRIHLRRTRGSTLDLWAYANDVTLDFSRPGKPTDNGFILRRGN